MVEPPRRGMGGGGEVDRLCPKRGACRRPASPSGSPTAIGLVFGLSKRTRAKDQGDELFFPCSESLPTNQRARQTRGRAYLLVWNGLYAACPQKNKGLGPPHAPVIGHALCLCLRSSPNLFWRFCYCRPTSGLPPNPPKPTGMCSHSPLTAEERTASFFAPPPGTLLPGTAPAFHTACVEVVGGQSNQQGGRGSPALLLLPYWRTTRLLAAGALFPVDPPA
jgi:hypothetical protein